MPDWRGMVRRRLAGLDLPPADEIDIVEELAQHLEERYCELTRAGVTGERALAEALGELDDEGFGAELVQALEKPEKRR